MTLSPETIEARKWCIETALAACEDITAAPGLAAELIALLEADQYEGRAPLNISQMMVGLPETEPPPPEPSQPVRAAASDLSRTVPRRVTPLPDGPDLSGKEQAVLAAIYLLCVGKDWPTQAQLSEAADVPRGSLNYVLERLLEKGYLARPDGKWAVAEPVADRAAE